MEKNLKTRRVSYKNLYLEEQEKAENEAFRANRMDAVAQTYFEALCEYGSDTLDRLTKKTAKEDFSKKKLHQKIKVHHHEWVALACQIGTMTRFDRGQDKHDLPEFLHINGRLVVTK